LFVRKVIYFAPDSSDQAVFRRVEGLQSLNVSVLLCAFHRERYNREKPLSCESINLGLLNDRSYLRRVALIFRSIAVVVLNQESIKDAEFFYARNLDMLLLTLTIKFLLWKRVKVVYEVLDIRAIQTKKSFFGIVVRLVERFLLKGVNYLVVSSPKFIDAWYRPLLGKNTQPFVIENKLQGFPKPIDDIEFIDHTPIVIGWFGTIRCLDSLKVLVALARERPDRILIKIAGVPSRIGRSRFLAMINGLSNIHYIGPYDASKDLPSLYTGVHFNWVSDFSDKSDNSQWLLPNRIYEGGYFQVPALSVGNSYCSEIVVERSLGVNLAELSSGALVEFFDNMNAKRYSELKKIMKANKSANFVDCNDILKKILFGEP